MIPLKLITPVYEVAKIFGGTVTIAITLISARVGALGLHIARWVRPATILIVSIGLWSMRSKVYMST
jgi:hypothetical protein